MRWRAVLNGLVNCLLVLGSVVFCFLAVEAYLRINSALNPPPPAAAASPIPPPSDPDSIVVPAELVARAKHRHALLMQPEEWKRKDLSDASAGYRLGLYHARRSTHT
jgi:hypothetical protein